jgi:uncharacterized membrane protein YedE/YeeE
MTFPLSPEVASDAVRWGGLLIGLMLGAVAQATRFCTMGALTDWFTYGGTTRLMMWVIAVAVAAFGSILLLHFGLLDATKLIAWNSNFLWLSYAVGGSIFGFGMVLASGCPQRNLVRAGAGNLRSVVTLLVASISAQMTLRGLFAVPRTGLLDKVALQLSSPQDLGSILSNLSGFDAVTVRWCVFVLSLLVAATFLWRNRRSLELSHSLGGIGVGLCVSFALFLTGYVGFIPEHPDTLEQAWMGTYSHRPEALTFAAPLAHSVDLLTLWSDKNTTASYGVLVCLGVLLGSAGAALARKEFRIESFGSSTDLINHLIGGLMIGFGGITAMGCSIGQGVSGLALQSAGACIAVTGIVGGAWVALRVQSWRLERSAHVSA